MLTVLLIIGLLLGAATGAAAQTALPVNDALDVLQFEDRQPIVRSSDGRYLTAAVNRPSRSAALAEPNTRYFVRSGVPATEALGDDIVVIDVRTGTHVDVTGGRGSSWGPAWSPDGRSLAFYSDRDGSARLWTWDRDSHALRRVSAEVVRPFWSFETPRWFPDGTRLLVKLLPEGMSLDQGRALLPEPTTPRETAGAGRSPTDAGVKVFASSDGLLDRRRDTSRTPPSSASEVHFLNRSLGDLAIVDLATGRPRRVASRVRAQSYSLSPDGRYAFYTAVRWIETAGRGDVVYSLIVLDLTDGRTRTLATDALHDYGITVSWAPTGHRIAYVDSAGIVVVGAATTGAPLDEWKELRRISRTGLRFRSSYAAPLWSADGTHLYMTARDSVWEASVGDGAPRSLGTVPGSQLLGLVGNVESGRVWAGDDGSAVYAIMRERSTLRMGFARIPLAGGGARRSWSADLVTEAPRFAAAPANDGTVAFVAQDAAHPEDIWLFRSATATARRVSALHPNLARYTLGRSRVVSWRSASGDTLRGALLLPSSYQAGKRYPLVVHVYPGSTPSRDVNRFGLSSAGGAYNQQLLATRGYAVLFPDVPLSGGKPVDDLAAAVVPAVERVVELGIADSARVGVTGYSAGGYATLALLTRSTRFAAAIAEQGGASLMGDYLHMRSDGSAPGIARVEGYGDGMGGSPWDSAERLAAYMAQSPLFHLDRITTPVLLVHGEADEIVPSAFSGEVFVGLRRLGKPVVIALYEGEGHGTGSWRRANLDDYWERVFAWWQRWLR